MENPIVPVRLKHKPMKLKYRNLKPLSTIMDKLIKIEQSFLKAVFDEPDSVTYDTIFQRHLKRWIKAYEEIDSKHIAVNPLYFTEMYKSRI